MNTEERFQRFAASFYSVAMAIGAYYPDVPSCPEPWVPVPAQ